MTVGAAPRMKKITTYGGVISSVGKKRNGQLLPSESKKGEE